MSGLLTFLVGEFTAISSEAKKKFLNVKHEADLCLELLKGMKEMSTSDITNSTLT